jgi:hypothetical protein
MLPIHCARDSKTINIYRQIIEKIPSNHMRHRLDF